MVGKILENREILEILESPQTVEKKGESDHVLEVLENVKMLEILEIPPVIRPFRSDPFFRSQEMAVAILWAPGISLVLLLENPHAHKIPRFEGFFRVFVWGVHA